MSRHRFVSDLFVAFRIPNHERIKLLSPPLCQLRCNTDSTFTQSCRKNEILAQFWFAQELCMQFGWYTRVVVVDVDRKKNYMKFADIVNGLCGAKVQPERYPSFKSWERVKLDGWRMDDEKCVTQGSLSQARRRLVFTGVQSSSLGLAIPKELLDLFFSIHFYAFDRLSLFFLVFFFLSLQFPFFLFSTHWLLTFTLFTLLPLLFGAAAVDCFFISPLSPSIGL